MGNLAVHVCWSSHVCHQLCGIMVIIGHIVTPRSVDNINLASVARLMTT